MKNILFPAQESYITVPDLHSFHQYEMPSEWDAIREHVRQLDEIEQANADLHKVEGALSRQLDSGQPLSETTLAVTQTAVEAICSRFDLGLSCALEQIVDKHKTNQRYYSEMALESVVDTVKRGIQKLIEMITNIWNHIKAFFQKLISNRENTEDELKRLSAEADKLPSGKPSEDTLQIATESVAQATQVATAFTVDGKCSEASVRTVIDQQMALIMSNREIIVHIVKCMDCLSKDGLRKNDVFSGIDKLVDDIKGRISRLPMRSKKFKDNKTIYDYGMLYQNQTCRIEETVAKSDVSESTRAFNIDVHIEKPEDPDISAPQVLLRDGIKALTDHAMKLMQEANQLDKVIPIVDKVLYHTLDHLKAHVNERSSYSYETAQLAVDAIKDLFRYISKNMPKVSMDASRISCDVVTYIKLSIQKYHEPNRAQ